MATKNDENVFSSPWNGSDMVLVVQDQELHVHKSFLTLQSPVFKAMFDGHFQEAGQGRITLKEKDLQTMVQFLRLLYPPSMIREAKSPLDDKSRLSIMALADEYQCVNLIQQCIDEIKITPENVWRILPYAVKYYQTALPRMYDVINWGVPTAKLGKLLPEIEAKETSNTILLTKCRFLESSVVKMQDAIVSLICEFLPQKMSLDAAYENIIELQVALGSKNTVSLTYANTSSSKITSGDSRCFHIISVGDISRIKGCLSCKEKYIEKFLNPIPICSSASFIEMLESGNDVATAVKEQK